MEESDNKDRQMGAIGEASVDDLNKGRIKETDGLKKLIQLYKRGMIDEHIQSVFVGTVEGGKVKKEMPKVKIRKLGSNQFKIALINALENDSVDELEKLRIEQEHFFEQDKRWGESKGLWDNGVNFKEDLGLNIWGQCVLHESVECMQYLVAHGYDAKKSLISQWLSYPMEQRVTIVQNLMSWRSKMEKGIVIEGWSRDQMQEETEAGRERERKRYIKYVMEQFEQSVQTYIEKQKMGNGVDEEPMVYKKEKGLVSAKEGTEEEKMPALLAMLPDPVVNGALGLGILKVGRKRRIKNNDDAYSEEEYEKRAQRCTQLVLEHAGPMYVDQMLLHGLTIKQMEQVESYGKKPIDIRQVQRALKVWDRKEFYTKSSVRWWTNQELELGQRALMVLEDLGHGLIAEHAFEPQALLNWCTKTVKEYIRRRGTSWLDEKEQEHIKAIMLYKANQKPWADSSAWEKKCVMECLEFLEKKADLLEKKGEQVQWFDAFVRLPQKIWCDQVRTRLYGEDPNIFNAGLLEYLEVMIDSGLDVENERIWVNEDPLIWDKVNEIQEEEVQRAKKTPMDMATYALLMDKIGVAKVLWADEQLRTRSLTDPHNLYWLSQIPIDRKDVLKEMESWGIDLASIVDRETGNTILHQWALSEVGQNHESALSELKKFPKLFWKKNNEGKCAYEMVRLGTKEQAQLSIMEKEHIKEALRVDVVVVNGKKQKIDHPLDKEGTAEGNSRSELAGGRKKRGSGFGKAL